MLSMLFLVSLFPWYCQLEFSLLGWVVCSRTPRADTAQKFALEAEACAEAAAEMALGGRWTKIRSFEALRRVPRAPPRRRRAVPGPKNRFSLDTG